MTEFERLLTEGAASFSLRLTERQVKRFSIYCDTLLEWNQKMNLTAIKEPNEVAVRHFVDSLTLLSVCEIKEGARLIDVGTGAGFPGVPLKIVREDIALCLLDSLNKRLVFLKALLESLEMYAALIHSRAEEGGRQKELRECFDVATSRAVASLNLLSEYCLPFVKVGGLFASMKGPACEEEIESAKPAIKALGGEIEEIKRFKLPKGGGRTVVLIRKIVDTPEEYPRHGSKIAKKPL